MPDAPVSACNTRRLGLGSRDRKSGCPEALVGSVTARAIVHAGSQCEAYLIRSPIGKETHQRCPEKVAAAIPGPAQERVVDRVDATVVGDEQITARLLVEWTVRGAAGDRAVGVERAVVPSPPYGKWTGGNGTLTGSGSAVSHRRSVSGR
jgi:hypothetical protein